MTPRVSVVLPVFNAGPGLRVAIDSIRAQTLANWELLVVDDGSTDGSAEMADSAAQADRRIKVIHRPHEGLVPALSAGISEARGEFVARMDADDESYPRRLREQVALLDANAAVGLVGCRVEFGGDHLASAGYAHHVDWANSLVTAEDIVLNRFIESPFAHPSVMFRRALVERWGGYRAGDFPEDYELWLRWLDAGVRPAKVPEVLLRWNDAPTRVSRTDSRYAPEAFFRLKAKWIARELARRGAPVDSGTRTASARAVWVWGAGRPTRKRAAELERHGVTITGYIDVDPKKIGHPIAGRPVVSASALGDPRDAFVLIYVGSRGARELIRATLLARGYQESSDFLTCA